MTEQASRINVSRMVPSPVLWEQANRHVLWGWKRDVGAQKRMVYFSGELQADAAGVYLARYFLGYWTVTHASSADHIATCLRKTRLPRSELTRACSGELHRIQYLAGWPTTSDLRNFRRLKLRRPRKQILRVNPTPASVVNARSLFPADLYVGSGLSYEAGLPTLCDMHEIFGVDSADSATFAVGESDSLPFKLMDEGSDRIRRFCTVHIGALTAEVTPAMRAIARFWELGYIRRIFTDNVDNMLTKVGVPFERVRGTGVFNERYPASFGSNTLIVVGVAADRRQIIKQARSAGCKIVTVNPISKVSPNVTHLDYVAPGDLFLKMTAFEFFATATKELIQEDAA